MSKKLPFTLKSEVAKDVIDVYFQPFNDLGLNDPLSLGYGKKLVCASFNCKYLDGLKLRYDYPEFGSPAEVVMV
ncbi:hypothetical protein [Candidatus Magnetobacterium casense]|uniref:hypothetical protein n=1 Tax=Candidatus Magnetobacterium casense TaxID=1455061 RepID=UPI00058EA0C0|nr:hypothetical protein [Candidatus Magnetobacterium casensis]